jgi:cis-3-alkyl-4-acyloxetan-2-one decarboxylase
MRARIPETEYPFESRFFDRGDGIKLHYLDEGMGDPVVMVHGNPSWSFYFRKLVKALKGEYRVIVPDHVGMGLSDKPGDARYSYTLKSRVDDLDALLDKLGLNRNVTLVLHDWGGMIGMAYACRHPERIKKLVILNTAAFGLPEGKKLPPTLRLCRDSRLGAFLVRRFNAFSLGATYFCATAMRPEIRKAFTAPYDSWENRIATLRFVQDIPLSPKDESYALVEETSRRLGQFQNVPMLVCWGGKDFVFDDKFLKEWIRRFPKAKVRYFAEAGHYVLEDAGEEIAKLVRAFLESPSLIA